MMSSSTLERVRVHAGLMLVLVILCVAMAAATSVCPN